MRIRLKAVFLWLTAAVLLAVVSIPPLIGFTLPEEYLITHALPDQDYFTIPINPVVSRLARFRISLWKECPVDLHSPTSVIGAAIAAYDGSSANQKKVIRDLVAHLIEIGCSPNQYGETGFTPLMDAVLFGNPETVSMLLALGADPLLRVKAASSGAPSSNQQRKDLVGMTALEFAQWLQTRGGDRQNEKAAIVALLWRLRYGS